VIKKKKSPLSKPIIISFIHRGLIASDSTLVVYQLPSMAAKPSPTSNQSGTSTNSNDDGSSRSSSSQMVEGTSSLLQNTKNNDLFPSAHNQKGPSSPLPLPLPQPLSSSSTTSSTTPSSPTTTMSNDSYATTLATAAADVGRTAVTVTMGYSVNVFDVLVGKAKILTRWAGTFSSFRLHYSLSLSLSLSLLQLHVLACQ
jgi:hypothetical protein